MVSVPTNKALYARVKAEAKRKFKVWPSAYGSGWLVKEYKRRGGKYKVTSKSRRKSSKKRRKSTKKRRKSTKKRRKSTKKRRKSTKKRRKSTKKRRKSTKKRSRAPVKKSPMKSYYKKKPAVSKTKKPKKSKRITIHRRPQLSRQMSVEDRNFYRPSIRLPQPGERIPIQYMMRPRPGTRRIQGYQPLPYYRESRAPKKTKRRRSKSKKRKSKRSVQSGLGRWFAEEWINVCKLPKIVPCGRSKAKWKNYPYCRPRRRINKGTPKTARELTKAEIDRRCKRKRSSPKKRVTGKSKSRRRK